MTAMTRFRKVIGVLRVVSSIILEVTLNDWAETKHSDNDRPHVNKKTAGFCLMISFPVSPTPQNLFFSLLVFRDIAAVLKFIAIGCRLQTSNLTPSVMLEYKELVLSGF